MCIVFKWNKCYCKWYAKVKHYGKAQCWRPILSLSEHGSTQQASWQLALFAKVGNHRMNQVPLPYLVVITVYMQTISNVHHLLQ